MFGNLFADEETESTNSSQNGICKQFGVAVSPPPRPSCDLCGIANQGATCYLNSLLQTLLFTPEFRESLFKLGPSNLGCIEDKNNASAKVRIIPIELQNLFAHLLLSNQQTASTSKLTDSFGWTDHEELQQHDVQELNRILFSAIEASLVGTPGQDLIRWLYHGTIVNQIICGGCGRVSEREEDFLDITLTVTGHSLENCLYGMFCDMEIMNGLNQYRCDTCVKLVNAKKGARIRKLPPILTISLLRFSFNFEKMERYKETGKLAFPQELDMSKYMEYAPADAEDSMYELFSVVIHRGGAHGGHYHVYIRDVDSLGTWTHPDQEEVHIPSDPALGKIDFIKFDSPLQLIQALLEREQGGQGMSIDQLCAELSAQTGVSWNKRFKKNYGPIVKFLKLHSDVFTFDQASSSVQLKSHGGNGPGSADTGTGPEGSGFESVCPSGDNPLHRTSRPSSPVPVEGHRWFDFNDSRVSSISQTDLEKTFSGKESAYMLFYRARSLHRPDYARGDPSYGLPAHILAALLEENDRIDKQREAYDLAINKITVTLHFSQFYDFRAGGLHAIKDSPSFLELSLDRRKTVSELVMCIKEVAGELVAATFSLYKMKILPAGGHLYQQISFSCDIYMKDCDILHNSHLFVCIADLPPAIPIGPDCAPVLLTVIHGNHGNPVTIQHGFPSNMTLAQFKMAVCDLCDLCDVMDTSDLIWKRVVGRDDDSVQIVIEPGLGDCTLVQLELTDFNRIIVESRVSSSDRASQNVYNHSIQNGPMPSTDAPDDVLYPEFIVPQDMLADEESVRDEIAPPKDYLRLCVSLYPTLPTCNTDISQSTGIMGWLQTSIQGLWNGSASNPSPPEPHSLGNIEISCSASLDDLKLQLLTLPKLSQISVPTRHYVRVRCVENAHLGKVFRDGNLSLEKLKMKSHQTIAVQILTHEEILSHSDIVLVIRQKVPDSRSYEEPREFIWDLSKGASPDHLRQAIADALHMNTERVAIAKHVPEMWEWLFIQNVEIKQKKKQKNQRMTNVRHSPFFLKDGDLIGVKDLMLDTAHIRDFSTEEDDRGKIKLQAEIEEKRRQKLEREKFDPSNNDTTRRNRPEIGIHIKVDKFT